MLHLGREPGALLRHAHRPLAHELARARLARGAPVVGTGVGEHVGRRLVGDGAHLVVVVVEEQGVLLVGAHVGGRVGRAGEVVPQVVHDGEGEQAGGGDGEVGLGSADGGDGGRVEGAERPLRVGGERGVEGGFVEQAEGADGAEGGVGVDGEGEPAEEGLGGG